MAQNPTIFQEHRKVSGLYQEEGPTRGREPRESECREPTASRCQGEGRSDLLEDLKVVRSF